MMMQHNSTIRISYQNVGFNYPTDIDAATLPAGVDTQYRHQQQMDLG
jgi:hypothetical protein